MGKIVEKAVWLSFDLGIGGDYPGLYTWLDNHGAIECGESVAFFKYSIDAASEADLVTIVKKDIEAHVKLRAGDRLYIIRREVTARSCSVKGDFITGKRKGSPWEGYGDSDSSSSDSDE